MVLDPGGFKCHNMTIVLTKTSDTYNHYIYVLGPLECRLKGNHCASYCRDGKGTHLSSFANVFVQNARVSP